MVNKQDGKASIPLWYRSFLIRSKLSWALALLDKAGSYHDKTIQPLGHVLAGLYFAISLVYNFVVGLVACGVIPALFVIALRYTTI